MGHNCQTVIFSDKAYNAIIDETFRKHPIETGGILLGHVLDNGLWIVMEVIPPGIDSIHQYAYFEYDEKFVNYLAESVASKYAIKLELLGLWHRHPGSMDTFSGTDDGTNSLFASLSPYGAISALVNVDPNFRLTMRHVSNPLHYEVVDFEIGDYLIPESYFNLCHYPYKDLNPPPTSHSASVWKPIESMPKQKSRPDDVICSGGGNIKNKGKSVKWLVAILLAAFCLILFTMINTSHNILMDDVNKKAVLVEQLYNPSDIGRLYDIGLLSVTQDMLVPSDAAIDTVAYAFLMIAFFILLAAVFTDCFVCRGFWYYIAASGIIALLIVFLLPIELSIAFFTFTLLLTTGLGLICTSIICAISVMTPNKRPWYKRNKNRYAQEDLAIRALEPDAEGSFEDGKLVYTIVRAHVGSEQTDTLAYQMVFSSNYLKDSLIRIYLIMPDIDDVLRKKKSNSLFVVKTDNVGEKYLELNDDASLNGADTIKRFYKWIDDLVRI